MSEKNKQRRKSIVSAYVKLCDEIDIPDRIIKKINKLYPQTKKYNFVRNEQIEENDVLYFVNLDLSHLSIGGKCVRIYKYDNGAVHMLLLYNYHLDIYWKVKPTKYYIFRMKHKSELLINALMEKFHRDIKNKT